MSGWDRYSRFKGKLKEIENEGYIPAVEECPEIDLSIEDGDGQYIDDQYINTTIRIGNEFKIKRFLTFACQYLTYDN